MKLITAIKMIEEREKRQRKTEKEMRRNGIFLKNNSTDKENSSSNLKEEQKEQKNLVHVQSIFPQDDIVALKVKTREAHVREAISKAVYFYLKSANEDRT
ncbi:MAG TPA: DUF5371 family protein [Candidatus Methanoperedens sp.]|nr:DUF5371 family protein [Candidatus Methanoperedens sp.]